MADRDLVALLRELERHPDDPEPWQLLGKLVERLGGVPPTLDGRIPLRDLCRAWLQSPLREPIPNALFRDLSGLAPLAAETEPGSWWQDEGRATAHPGGWFDLVTGLPLRVARCRDGAPMRLVPEGPVPAGWLRLHGFAVPAGAARVAMEAFYLDELPITNDRYRAWCVRTGHPLPPLGERLATHPADPVVLVTSDEAAAYAADAGGRLASPLEWLWAAGGPDGARYPRECRDYQYSWSRRPPAPGREFAHLGPVGLDPEDRSVLGVREMQGAVLGWGMDGTRALVLGDRYGSLTPDPDDPISPPRFVRSHFVGFRVLRRLP